MRSIELRELLAIEVDVLPVFDVGGGLRYVPFAGGRFSGRDGLSGTIGAGGIDWQRIRPDGVLEIDARYVLVTQEGEAIEVRSTGLRKASPEVADRIQRGEPVAPEEYYFRTHVRLRTAAPRLQPMNDLLGVATGQRTATSSTSTSTRSCEGDRHRCGHRRPRRRARPSQKLASRWTSSSRHRRCVHWGSASTFCRTRLASSTRLA